MIPIIPVNLRFVLIAVLILGGVVASFYISFWWALPFIVVGIVLLIGYLLLGTLNSTGMLMQQGKYDEAEAQLAKTYFPKYLLDYVKPSYNMIKITLHMVKERYDEADELIKDTLKMKLGSDNERASLMLYQVGILSKRGHHQGAKNLLRQLKDLHVTDANVKEQIRMIESNYNQLPNRIVPGHTHMSPGGKRPRPRIR